MRSSGNGMRRQSVQHTTQSHVYFPSKTVIPSRDALRAYTSCHERSVTEFNVTQYIMTLLRHRISALGMTITYSFFFFFLSSGNVAATGVSRVPNGLLNGSPRAVTAGTSHRTRVRIYFQSRLFLRRRFSIICSYGSCRIVA